MKKMTALISATLIATSMNAFAQETDVKNFPVTQAQMSEFHSNQRFDSGKVEINYPLNSISISINNETLEFPIVAVEAGACGATEIRAALQNPQSREHDQVTITDNTTMICRILMPSQGTLTWKSFVNGETFVSHLVLGGRKPL